MFTDIFKTYRTHHVKNFGLPHSQIFQLILARFTSSAALGGIDVSVLATGPMGLAAAGSSPAKGSGFLWLIKICNTQFLRRGSKADGPML
jgi:hypothetical protein